MALSSGTRLGPYEIVAPIGAGGMGEVYRAKDTRLDRTVAIKVLAAHLSSSPEQKQRFEREARSVSALNHAHICQLYDVGSQGGSEYLVMEYLEGETLAERLRKGALPLNELLKTAMEIAEALEVAHRAGIIHRDLKPANIMLTKSGAKLMDFGLAKPAVMSGAGTAPLLSAAQTISGPSPMSPLTTAGMIVGTILYMSPEQIEGKEADARADIFSFGAVLYEMATGKRPFEGKSQLSVASAILEKEPEPISAANPVAPASLDYLVSTCLAKDREERIQTAHDVRLQLKGISQSPAASAAVVQEESPRRLWPWLALAGAAILLVAAGVIYFRAQRSDALSLSVLAYIPPPPGTAFRASGGLDVGPVAVSPDGKTLAFSAVDEKGVTKLWLRPLDAQQAAMLPGTEDAAYPFWSPDSQYLGFFADGKLRKISVPGGASQTLVDGVGSEAGIGGWSADGTILFCKDRYGSIYRVAATGGEATPVTKLEKTEIAQRQPFFLPDGKHFLYVSNGLDFVPQIKVADISKPEQASVAVANGGMPQFASGQLLFVSGGHIEAQPFDLRTWKLSGDPRSLGEAEFFSVSTNGVLAYHEGSGVAELKIYDRTGSVVATPGPLGRYESPRFSPDGKRIGVIIADPRTGKNDIWAFPVEGGQPDRLTFGPNDSFFIWSPNGKEIAYQATENGKDSIRRRPLDGSRPEDTLYKNEANLFSLPIDWTPDGKYISMHVSNKQGIFTNWSLPVAGGQAFRPAATANLTESEFEGRFSSDGRWLCYFAYESGRPEVYVVPFPGAGAKTQVSTTGGWLARFSRNELFYVTLANRLMVAQFHTQPSFGVDSVRPLFQMDFPNVVGSNPMFDVSQDGQHFAVLTADRAKSASITLLTNWPAELKK
ncbi:MAG TPA: protein kinase [Candidatus Acidoferrales bacterium]|nr:protein kinase [Candidatus Acidoferrales bacterium]